MIALYPQPVVLQGSLVKVDCIVNSSALQDAGYTRWKLFVQLNDTLTVDGNGRVTEGEERLFGELSVTWADANKLVLAVQDIRGIGRNVPCQCMLLVDGGITVWRLYSQVKNLTVISKTGMSRCKFV